MKKVMLVGEGPNELGGWSGDPTYKREEQPGVVETILRQVQNDGWAVERGLQWKKIRKYKAGDRARPEKRNVLGAVWEAKRTGCDVVVFVRDRDGSNGDDNRQRQRDVEEGLSHVDEVLQSHPDVVGGVAVKKLESWLVAISGKNGAEEMRRPEEYLHEKFDIPAKGTAAMCAHVETHGLGKVPDDAKSLNLWLSRAREVFCDERAEGAA